MSRKDRIKEIAEEHLEDPQRAYDEIEARGIPCTSVELYMALQEANNERTARAHRRIDVQHALLVAFIAALIVAGVLGSIWPFLFKD